LVLKTKILKLRIYFSFIVLRRKKVENTTFLLENESSNVIENTTFSLENEDSNVIENIIETEINVITSKTSATDQAEMYFLQKEIENMKKEKLFLKNHPFGYHSLESDNKLFEFYCGISKSMFLIIVDLCSKVNFSYYYSWNVEKFCLKDQILMTLIKLRLNLAYPDLAFRFKTSESTIGNIILTLISVLHEILYVNLMNTVPSQNKNRFCLPECFNNFQNCRITLDCTEISCDIPKSLLDQKLTYSSYKHKNTLKGLIGVAPNGVITYASKLYPGSTSDKKIVGHCGVLNILHPGDLVLADKGFLISDLMPPETFLNIPPFLMSPQFTPSEVLKTKSIARARIHVERVMVRLKKFKILTHIPKALYTKSSLVFQLCAALVNFQNPLIKEVEHLYTKNDNIQK